MKKRSLLVAVAVLGIGQTAFADDPTPKIDNRARAQQLFDSALADAEKGDLAHACPKFHASQEADPKASTLLNLANCYEKNGQTASAWGAYREAEGLARKTNHPDWEATAKTHAEALEPKLNRLTITVKDEAKVPGLAITRDGAKLSQGEWGVAIPVDPGDHVVGASADGYISIEKHVPVAADAPDNAFVLPTLEKLPEPPREPEPEKPELPKGWPRGDKPIEKPHWSKMEVGGVVTGSIGVLALAGGGLIAIVAAGNYDNAKSHCTNGIHGCDSGSIKAANDAFDLAGIATVTIVSGLVLLGAGAALVWFSPSDKKLARADHLFQW
jgi:hypothetical protein